MAEYRIVRDSYAGYEVQIRRWWLPIWVQVGSVNTHLSIEKAEEFARRHANPEAKYLGRLSGNGSVTQENT